MSTKSQENILVADLMECRQLAISRLADFEAEQGNTFRQQAWIWFRDTGRWPSKRADKKGKWWSVDTPQWGWNVVTKYRTLEDCKNAGPTYLPYDLKDWCGWRGNNYSSTERGAVLQAIRFLSQLFEKLHRWKENEKSLAEEKAATNESTE